MNRDQLLDRNCWLFPGLRACGFGLAASVPTMTDFWRARGLSEGDFFLLQIIFALALVVLEVVTGRFADRFGKVLTLRIGFAISACGTLVYALSGSMFDLIVGEILMALGLALNSGTDEAFLYQSYRARQQNERFQSAWGFCTGLGFVAMAAFSALGGWISHQSVTAPYYLAFGFQGCAFLGSLFLYEPADSRAATSEGEKKHGTIFEAATALLFSSAMLLWMVIATSFSSGVNQTVVWVYPDYLSDCHLTEWQRGIVFSVFNLIAGVSAFNMRQVKGVRLKTTILFTLLILVMLSSVSMMFVFATWAWIALLPQQVLRTASGVFFSKEVNDAIPSHIRATALSIRNAIRVFLYVAALSPWWLFVDHWGRGAMLGFNVVVMAIGSALLLAAYRRCVKE